MKYVFIACYDRAFNIPDNPKNIYISIEDNIYEYKRIPRVRCKRFSNFREYENTEHSIKFVLYKKKIEIFQDGKLVNKFKSSQNIIVCDGAFLVKIDASHGFIISNTGCVYNVLYNKNIVYFTNEGIVYYMDGFQLMQKSCKCYYCWHSIRSSADVYHGNLFQYKKGLIIKFNQSQESVEIDDSIAVYRGTAEITEVLDVSAFVFDKKEITVVLTTTSLFLIHENIIVSKKQKGFRKIDPDRRQLHNYFDRWSFDHLICYFNIFTQFVCCNISFFREIVSFYDSKSKNSKLEDYWKNFLSNIKDCDREVCKAYRVLDDNGKEELLPYIDFRSISAESLALVIQYHQDKLPLLIEKCIRDKKLHVLYDIYIYQKKIEQVDDFQRMLLEENILFEKADGYQDVFDMQMYEVNSHRVNHSKLIDNFDVFTFGD